MYRKIICVVISLILFSIPWFGGPGYFLFAAFVPLLALQEDYVRIGKKEEIKQYKQSYLPWYGITFLLWNIINVYWIKNAVWIGAVAAVLINTILMSMSFMVYHYIWKRARKPLAYTVLVTAWISAEYIYTQGQVSFPWLLLGNGFSCTIRAVQWYEYTGIFGGSLWVLVMNLLIYEAVKKFRNFKHIRSFIAPLLTAVIPIALSLYMYHNYDEQTNPIIVEVIQPNIDPYEEKFGTMAQREQTDIMLTLAGNAPKDVDFIVTPETAVDQVLENEINYDRTLASFKRFLYENYPDASFVIGATSYRRYISRDEKTATARYRPSWDDWYDAYNSAIFVDTTDNVNVYHKSKLVIGAETMPFHEELKFLEKFSLDLGGFTGLLGKDYERKVFATRHDKKVGVAICYESVYGEYCGEYIAKGAEALFIITNDGWWGNTAGHRQHFNFARLRAIEHRRSIARSANTGISGFIDQRGNVISNTQWDERVSQTGRINLNKKVTFYSKYGDMVGRICDYVFLLSVLYYISYNRRRKDLIVE